MDNLKKLRKERNLSMKKLGEELGVAESTISLYESGKREPDNNMIKKMASYFNVTTDHLLGVSKYNLRNEITKTISNRALTISEFAREVRISTKRLKEIIDGDEATIKETNAICTIMNISFLDCCGASRDWHLNLKSIREKNGKSAFDIIELFRSNFPSHQMSVIRYDNIEAGREKPSYDELIEIVKFLDISIYDLLAITPEEQIKKINPSSKEDGFISQIYSDDELELLNDYKSLSTQGKEYIRQTMLMAKTIYKKDSTSSDLGVG